MYIIPNVVLVTSHSSRKIIHVAKINYLKSGKAYPLDISHKS